MEKQTTGKLGEKLAIWFLKTKGYKIIQTNFHTRRGEIDIIAKQNKTLVFVEVKTRSNFLGGYPEEAVTPIKLQRLQAAINQYLFLQSPSFNSIRIDVISVDFTNKFRPKIKHLKNIMAANQL